MARKPTMDELRRMATRGDVTYLINRWFDHLLQGSCYDPDIARKLLEIQRVGYVGMATSYLRSMRPEEMYRPIRPGERYPSYQPVETQDGKIQIGSYSRGQRLTAARRWAKKAGVAIEDIAADFRLTHLLLVIPEPEPEPIPSGC